ncbi:DUF1552 domain-containing protein [Lentisphaera marina]|uniref:DUF1552 domain-containing protein n=1 Tax=Lentisphaera marina TaxID=1111041 RepID=UPI0023672C11|nr:DUF1552 domain-containing protein [Lentisphaera marina]MDD7985219.1 DUF1552 domain-containing protein [Lentisphaera marina]
MKNKLTFTSLFFLFTTALLADGNGHGHGGKAMSYGEDGSPLPGLRSPLDVYHSLFGGGLSKQEQLQRLRREQSIFDLLKIDSTATKRTLSKDDREKLEEYSTGVREIEKSLSRQTEWANVPYPKATIPTPKSTLEGESEIMLMFKMITSAYQIDSTRIITYRMPDAGLLNSMNISHSPHTLSHYGVNSALHELNLKRSTKWLQLYSQFIDMMRSAKDPLDPNGGTLFDNSLVYWGGGLRTAHRNKNVPCFLTGGGFNMLKHGQHHIAPEDDTALANLWTTILQDAGAQITKFADSTGTAQTLYT